MVTYTANRTGSLGSPVRIQSTEETRPEPKTIEGFFNPIEIDLSKPHKSNLFGIRKLGSFNICLKNGLIGPISHPKSDQPRATVRRPETLYFIDLKDVIFVVTKTCGFVTKNSICFSSCVILLTA